MLFKKFVMNNNKLIIPFLSVLALNACTSIGKIDNAGISQLPKGDQRYIIQNYSQKYPAGETLFLLAFSGGAQKSYDHDFKNQTPPKRVVVIVVDASTSSETSIGKSTTLPLIGDTLSAVTDIQLHLYNTETNSLLKQKLMKWVEKLSTKEHPTTPYYIDLNVTDIQKKRDRSFFISFQPVFQ